MVSKSLMSILFFFILARIILPFAIRTDGVPVKKRRRRMLLSVRNATSSVSNAYAAMAMTEYHTLMSSSTAITAAMEPIVTAVV